MQDTGAIQVITEAPQSVSFAAMAERQQRARRQAILKEPDVHGLSSFIGVDGANATLNSGRMLVTLTPHERRSRTATEIIAALRERVARVPGHRPLHAAGAGPHDRGPREPHPVPVHARGSGRERLASGCRSWSSGCSSRPQLADVASDLQDRGLQAFLDIDRDAASRLGIRVAAIDDALYDAFGQRLISTIYTQANQYRVVLEVAPRFQIGPEALGQVFVATAEGRRCRSRNIASIEHRNTALVINHAGQFPAVTMSFNLAPGRLAGQGRRGHRACAARARYAAEHSDDVPGRRAQPSERHSPAAPARARRILTIYIVLGVLYESYIHPITILSTLPSAGVGALLALLSAPTSASSRVIGIILLIGIVKKNAIMMIDFALEAERSEG